MLFQSFWWVSYLCLRIELCLSESMWVYHLTFTLGCDSRDLHEYLFLAFHTEVWFSRVKWVFLLLSYTEGNFQNFWEFLRIINMFSHWFAIIRPCSSSPYLSSLWKVTVRVYRILPFLIFTWRWNRESLHDITLADVLSPCVFNLKCKSRVIRREYLHYNSNLKLGIETLSWYLVACFTLRCLSQM